MNDQLSLLEMLSNYTANRQNDARRAHLACPFPVMKSFIEKVIRGILYSQHTLFAVVTRDNLLEEDIQGTWARFGPITWIVPSDVDIVKLSEWAINGSWVGYVMTNESSLDALINNDCVYDKIIDTNPGLIMVIDVFHDASEIWVYYSRNMMAKFFGNCLPPPVS